MSDTQQEKPTKLWVGARVYHRRYGYITSTTVVERLTPTQAICADGTKFKIDIREGMHLKQIGGGSYSGVCYLETQKIKDEWEHSKLAAKLQNSVNYTSLSLKDLIAINAIVEISKLKNKKP
jgi:hypothetical protein